MAVLPRVGFLRSRALGHLPDTCQVQRPTVVTSGDGQATTYPVLATVACEVQPQGSAGSEAVAGGVGVRATGTFLVLLPAGTDVLSTDRIVVTTQSNRVLEVTEVETRSNEVLRHLICRQTT